MPYCHPFYQLETQQQPQGQSEKIIVKHSWWRFAYLKQTQKQMIKMYCSFCLPGSVVQTVSTCMGTLTQQVCYLASRCGEQQVCVE